MNGIRNQELAIALGYSDRAMTFEPLGGGFTQSEKYVVRSGSNDEPLFAKVVETANALETIVLDTEADHYRSLDSLGLTGKFFPAFNNYVHTDHNKALFIDYLPDAKWGGPWDQENVEKLLHAAQGVHAIEVPEKQKTHIQETAESMMEYLYENSPNTLGDKDYDRLYEAAWSADKSQVVNSRGQQYFAASPGLYQTIKTESADYDKRAGNRIIIRDTNFNNIAITDDKVVFVDPAYLDIGNPAGDMVTLGLNVLLVTPDDDKHRDLRQFVKDNFITDRLALARTVQQLLAIGTLKYGSGENPWMDYHQSMAEVALNTWHELYES